LKVVTDCKFCRKVIPIKASGSNRFELSKKVGKSISLLCPNCKKRSRYHLNNIRAERSLIYDFINPIAIVLGVGGLVMLWDLGTGINSYKLIPVFLIIVGSIATAISSHFSHKVKYFNAFLVD
jgi:hypothetical protein